MNIPPPPPINVLVSALHSKYKSKSISDTVMNVFHTFSFNFVIIQHHKTAELPANDVCISGYMPQLSSELKNYSNAKVVASKV